MGSGDLSAGEIRAVSSVQRLTRLSFDDAVAVVTGNRHDLYDGAIPSWGLRPGATLADDVHTVVADHLDVNAAAEIDSVEMLLHAALAPVGSHFRGRLKLRLPDGRLMHVWEDAWSVAEVSSTNDELEYWWTGVPAKCPDPLLVAVTLHHVAAHGQPEDDRRASSVEGLHVRSCQRCGGDIVPVVYGMPAGDTFALHELGQVVLGGCVPPFIPSYACAQCQEPAHSQ